MILPSRAFPSAGLGFLALVVGWSVFPWTTAPAADEPKPGALVSGMFGGSPGRNMVNLVAKNIPITWEVEEGKFKNVKWMAELGNRCYAGPLVVDGKVYVGTNNANPRDQQTKGPNKAVLMCFDEKSGKFLWQAVHDFPADELFHEALAEGLCSTPCVEGKRIYYVTPGCVVICADVANGKEIWRYDMMKELKVIPFHCSNCSPLIVGDSLMLVTSNGISNKENEVASPKAPSFIALDKNKGTLVWQNNLPGDRIIEGQWSNPAYGVVGGRPQVIFPGGDAVLYSLDPATGKLLWKCNCFPDRKIDAEDRGFGNYFVSTPVIHDNKLYIGMGIAPGIGKTTKFGYLLCLDMTKSGDVSPKTMDAKDPANKDSALLWTFGGQVNPKPAKGRQVQMGRTISTCAIHDGLLYIAEEIGIAYCLDARTGAKHWEMDLRGGTVWGSPYFVDGKVFLGSDSGEMTVFKAGKKMEILAKNEFEEGIFGTPVAANGVLFVATKSKLFAIAEKQ